MEKIISKHLASIVPSQRDPDQILDPTSFSYVIHLQAWGLSCDLDLPWRVLSSFMPKHEPVELRRALNCCWLTRPIYSTLHRFQRSSEEKKKRKAQERGGAASKPSWWTQLSCACNIKQGEHLERSIMIINRAISKTACALEMVQRPNKVFCIARWRLGAIFLFYNKSQWVFMIEWDHQRCEKSSCLLTLHVCSNICS